MRTVVVDDDEALRLLVRLTLHDDERFRVVGEAGDGKQAVDAAARLQPDLVLLDLKMPGMDGFAALPLIRAAAPKAKVVCLSMLQAADVRDRVLALGAAAFIDKSLPADRFMQHLARVLWPTGGRH